MNNTVSQLEAQETPGTQPEKRKKNKKSRKKLVLAVLLAAAVAAGGFGVYTLFFQKEERVAITGTTSYGSLNEVIEGSGTTTPADSVSYEVSGKVLEWNVSPGDEVKAGDLLYVLDSSDAEDQILEYEVELEDLYEQLSELQDNVNNQNVTADYAGRVEDVRVKEGQKVQSGATLATLVDDSVMEATLYFSYSYENAVYVGMPVTVSVPDQMLNLTGQVREVKYVDYVTTEGMHCFAAVIEVANPGVLTEGTTVACWAQGADGSEVCSVSDGQLTYVNKQTITAQASGELTAVQAADYQRVKAGELLFVIDASGYETQMETLSKQIENMEEKIADLQESIATEYMRYSDIDGQVVTANYSTNRMTGADMGSVVIYNQDTMQIAVNIDELDADYLQEGMEVYVYRTTSSRTESYPATLSYLSLEATAGSSGVSTFAATITINSEGKLSSGVTVYYSIDTGDSEVTGDTVLAPLNALCTYDDGYYLLVQRDKKPDNAIDPAAQGGTVTEFPGGYYAVPVEVGDYNASYVQILSGVEKDETIFLRYMNAAPTGGSSTSQIEGEEGMMPGDFSAMMPGDFSAMMPGGSGGMPSFGGSGGSGSMPSFGGSGGMPSGGGMPGGRG